MKKFFVVALFCVLLSATAWAYESDDILGETRDGTYTNTVMGAEAHFNQKWKVLSREEISALAGSISSASPTAKEILEKNLPVFVAVAGGGLLNVNITIDRLNEASKALIAMSSDLFVDMFMNRAAAGMASANKANGFEDSNIEIVKVRFLETECPGLFMTAKTHDMPVFQRQVMYRTDDYIFNVTFTSVGGNMTDGMLGMFRKLK